MCVVSVRLQVSCNLAMLQRAYPASGLCLPDVLHPAAPGKQVPVRPRPAAAADKENASALNVLSAAAAQQQQREQQAATATAEEPAIPVSRLEQRPLTALTSK